jgi:hypothetical protein
MVSASIDGDAGISSNRFLGRRKEDSAVELNYNELFQKMLTCI